MVLIFYWRPILPQLLSNRDLGDRSVSGWSGVGESCRTMSTTKANRLTGGDPSVTRQCPILHSTSHTARSHSALDTPNLKSGDSLLDLRPGQKKWRKKVLRNKEGGKPWTMSISVNRWVSPACLFPSISHSSLQMDGHSRRKKNGRTKRTKLARGTVRQICCYSFSESA